MASANHWLRGIKTYRLSWYLTRVSANHALSNWAQSNLALCLAVGRQERHRGTGILLPQDFCGKTMQAVYEAANQNIYFFEFLRVSPGNQPLAREDEDSVRDCMKMLNARHLLQHHSRQFC